MEIEQDLSGEVREYFENSCNALRDILSDSQLLYTILTIGQKIADALRAGNKVLLAGNGGSAADAQHLAGELVARLNFNRAPLPAIALTTDTSVLTAIANDFGFEEIFERQVNGLGRAGDILVGISTSGRSRNVLRAMSAARAKGLVTVGFTGKSAGEILCVSDICFSAPAMSTQIVQQLHITAGHAICALVENALFARH